MKTQREFEMGGRGIKAAGPWEEPEGYRKGATLYSVGMQVWVSVYNLTLITACIAVLYLSMASPLPPPGLPSCSPHLLTHQSSYS